MTEPIPVGNTYVYRHVRLDLNQPFYVGIGLKYRPNERSRRSKLWNNIYKKCEENYRVDVLFENVSLDFAKSKEIELIALYGRIDLGTGTLSNHTDGGEGMRGHRFSDETKKLMSLKATGRKKSPEHCRKLGLAKKGIPQSKESIQKRIESRKNSGIPYQRGCDHPGYGKKRAPEMIQILQDRYRWRIEQICKETGDVLNVFKGVREASDNSGEAKHTIDRLIHGLNVKKSKFLWKGEQKDNGVYNKPKLSPAALALKNVYYSKLIISQLDKDTGDLLGRFYGTSAAFRATGVNPGTIHNSLNHPTYRPGGFKWTSVLNPDYKGSR